jgi:hypothetical protein
MDMGVGTLLSVEEYLNTSYSHQWGIQVCTELRIKPRDGWRPIPDVCIYESDFEGRVPSKPPLLWIEELSAVWQRYGSARTR